MSILACLTGLKNMFIPLLKSTFLHFQVQGTSFAPGTIYLFSITTKFSIVGTCSANLWNNVKYKKLSQKIEDLCGSALWSTEARVRFFWPYIGQWIILVRVDSAWLGIFSLKVRIIYHMYDSKIPKGRKMIISTPQQWTYQRSMTF